MSLACAIAVGETVPAIVGVEYFAKLLGVSRSHVYRMQRRGDFQRFELEQPAHQKPRLYSGEAIARWLRGRAEDAPRQFFSSGRKRRAR